MSSIVLRDFVSERLYNNPCYMLDVDVPVPRTFAHGVRFGLGSASSVKAISAISSLCATIRTDAAWISRTMTVLWRFVGVRCVI